MNEQTEAPELVSKLIASICEDVSRSVFGHQHNLRLLVGAFVIGGHVLIEGPPGVAKTLLARSFASGLGLDFKRIQFTPDLMPSDITGVNIYDPQSSSFRFSPGPIFADIILADEINRTPPKTQAALLEAMEEHQVTIDGTVRPLNKLFFVIATQNPIEHEGTFPLPEAQLDRFLFKLTLSYPGSNFETHMIQKLSSTYSDTGFVAERLPGTTPPRAEDLLRVRKQLRTIVLSEAMSDYISRILQATREHPSLLLGASPRAGLYLALAAKLQAALDGRSYTIPDDAQAMAVPVLNHRLIIRPESYDAAQSASDIIEEILSRVAIPSSAT